MLVKYGDIKLCCRHAGMRSFRALSAHARASRQEREETIVEALQTLRAQRALAWCFGMWGECTKQGREAKSLQQERRSRRDKMDALLVKIQSGASKIQEIDQDGLVATASISEQAPGGRGKMPERRHSSSHATMIVPCHGYVCPVPMHTPFAHQELCQINAGEDAQKSATPDESQNVVDNQVQENSHDNINHLHMIASHTVGEDRSHHAAISMGEHQGQSLVPNQEEYVQHTRHSSGLVYIAKTSSLVEEHSCSDDDIGTYLCDDAEEGHSATPSEVPYVAKPGIRADGSCIRPTSKRTTTRGVAANVVEECAVVTAMKERERQRKERRQVRSDVLTFCRSCVLTFWRSDVLTF
jgi:hypothetical protein